MEVEEPLALEAARNYRAVELQVSPTGGTRLGVELGGSSQDL